MANIDVTPRAEVSVFGLLAAPFAFLGKIMVAIGEANAASRAAMYYLDLSDEELAARGLNREEQVRKAFAPFISF